MVERVKKRSDAWLDKLKPANSNTRISVGGRVAPEGRPQLLAGSPNNLGLTSDRLRMRMVERVRAQGVEHEVVLGALARVARHRFVDQALASRAYEDGALPIGHGQTISQPWVVARMLAALCEPDTPRKVLEIGTGCGYQAAVMSHIFAQVFTVERVRPLYDMAKTRLQDMAIRNVHCLFGDGMLGWSAKAPFDAIVVAAAGLSIPQTLLDQLAVGGKLIAPEGDTNQRLIMVTRQSTREWRRVELEAVRFVPLKPGVQT
ncbi:protein-L-isoaspartate(D-aspartate) O-methyltransferase [Orrella daihaiensis]|uniref:Protein-L-isoaspartate O-methyltransferase n=1 Tax=Orrella daihaiensis TaxID=2782176 RepID=A0ABY4AG93_9BURK|nr:protein-L-isoaspartate(D-aspartate) O-methyltransferase [Orrella daihaiensis]UOD49303.1 protein-L-isoaspartate(D-aspartate) O-methyltransferase [Orrella daihaiensis]